MEKRYQVFISSTYTDLIDERNKAMKSVMDVNCMPAGMELFPASNDEQFEYIKRTIDDSDYYVLIIGGRYGSLAKDGIGYTEKEFDYAMSKKIPVLAFLHRDIASLPSEKRECDQELKNKLLAFNEKAKTGRVINYWSNADELCSRIIVSLTQIFQNAPAIGWIRANVQTNTESLQELNDLRKEIAKLKEYKKNVEEAKIPENIVESAADLDDEIILMHPDGSKIGFYNKSWRQLFALIAPNLQQKQLEYDLESYIRGALQSLGAKGTLDLQISTIKVYFTVIGLIHSPESSLWQLTNKGVIEMYRTLCPSKKQ